MKRYLINFELAGPIRRPEIPIMLDSLLAYAAVREAGLVIAEPEEYNAVIEALPIRKIAFNGDYFYAASPLVFSDPTCMSSLDISKSNNYQRYLLAFRFNGKLPLECSNQLNQGNKEWKMGRISMPIISYKTASAVIDTDDIDKVMALLKNISFLGKKRSIGLGRVANITSQEAPEGTKIVRPLPADMFTVQGPVFAQRLKPAYWLQEDRYIAGMGELTC